MNDVGDLWRPDPLDEATRPVAPAPPRAASGENTGGAPPGMRAGQRLVRIHDHLREEMLQVRDVAERVAAGVTQAARARSEINDLTMRQNLWTMGSLCAGYCRALAVHHTIEDEHMFPELRRGQESLAPVLGRLATEHAVIGEVLHRLDAALVALMSDDDRMSDVRDHVDLLDRVLASHLAYEESQLVEPLDRLNPDI